jgi:uncharacterized membrane protein
MVLDVFSINWLDLLLGWLLSSIGVCREILSFESTLSILTGTRPLALKLF